MTQQEVLSVLKHISDSDEQCATDIMYALTLLSSNTEKMLNSIKEQIKNNVSENKFDEVVKLTDFCNHIIELNDQMELCISTLIRDSENTKKALEKNNITATKIDYGKYVVDQMEQHSLSEDFEYRRICAFKLNGIEFKVSSWQDTLVTLCEYIAKQDIGLIEKMMGNPDFTGRKVIYFQKEHFHRRNKLIPGTDIYVWINMSANSIVAFIRKILHYLNVPEEDFIVFLRADYSELHRG